MRTTKTMAKTTKAKAGLHDDDDSKPMQLAKLIYPAIIRMIIAKRSQVVAVKPKFVLDSGRARRISVDSD